ncbi:MAG: PKD domain-containing protein, partial [Cytophagales bacterium]|nr:PKD domain-containing protein [Cytophagales bacterium]
MPGAYTVTLIASNVYGYDTVIKTNYITYDSLGPQAAACIPATAAYCCGYGIYNITFNALNKTSVDGVDGYQDYSCNNGTSITEGIKYLFSVETNPGFPENVRAWIDFNNDTVFDNVTELIFVSDNVLQFHSDTIKIPGGAVLDTSLRLRVASDDAGLAVPTPCGTVTKGQYEDYAVTIQQNPNPPVADFIADKTTICFSTVNFTDLTVNLVNAWYWDFGDSVGTDTVQNPSYTYSTAGIFSVTLIVTNAYGSDTIIKTNYINVSPGPKAPSCTPATTGNCCLVGIYNVTFNTINNTTGDGSEGYQDYSCTFGTTVTEGQNYSISVQTNPDMPEHVRVWIDFNNDSVFNPITELVFADTVLQFHTGSIFIPGTAIKDSSLR